MKLISQRSLIRDVARAWAAQYSGERSPDKMEILRQLSALNGETATAAQVKRIIGNDSWTEVGHCDECGGKASALVQLGEEPDYESATATVCEKCIKRATLLFTQP